MNFYPTGVCSKEISFNVENNKVKNISFKGGCGGNLSAISILVENMDVDEVISKLNSITCGTKNTSCPQQLAKALEEYKSQK